MTLDLTTVLIALAFPFAVGAAVGNLGGCWGPRTGYGLSAVGCWVGWLACVVERLEGAGVIWGLLAAYFTWQWWKRRKGRGKKALKELGAKSRARVEALVRQMTRSPIPSPAGA
jgi:hypothetical protein